MFIGNNQHVIEFSYDDNDYTITVNEDDYNECWDDYNECWDDDKIRKYIRKLITDAYEVDDDCLDELVEIAIEELQESLDNCDPDSMLPNESFDDYMDHTDIDD